jgi:hypothetical protein
VKNAETTSGEDEKTETEDNANEPAARAEKKPDADEVDEEQVESDAAATAENEADAVTKDDEPADGNIADIKAGLFTAVVIVCACVAVWLVFR